MDTGFGQNLEGFLIKGNLSLIPSELPSLHGDGSIEGSGTLYIDTVREYNTDNGIDVQEVTFKNKTINVPYTAPSKNATSASILLSGGMSINTTQNATSVTSGGGLTVAGGVSIKKNLHVGGTVDVNNNKIVNVSLPIDGTDAVNKDYVDSVADRIHGDFTLNQVILGDSNEGDAIRGSDAFVFDEEKLLLDAPLIITDTTNAGDINSTTGSIVTYGGVIIKEDVSIGGTLNLNNNYIQNVSNPINPYDVATKEYVDNNKLQGNFTTGQVIIAASVGDEIRGFSNFTYDGSKLNLLSTENISGSNGGTFISYGGISIAKDLFIGGKITLDNNLISGVADPLSGSDVATKSYVDSKTYGNLIGSFGNHQVVVGTATGGILASYPGFLYDGTTLQLNSAGNLLIRDTTNATGLGTGGTFTTLGGGSFGKDVFIGGELDMNLKNIRNVQDPVLDYDAVNKEYVDNLVGSISLNISGNTFTLNNNITILPENIPNFYYTPYIKAFITSVIVKKNNNDYALYTLYGINCGNRWYLNSSYVGVPTGVKFYISNSGVMQYTNENTSGITAIQFKTISQIDKDPSSSQYNYTLLNSSTPLLLDMPELEYANNSVDAVKIILHLSSVLDDSCGLYLLNCVQKNGIWEMNTHLINNDRLNATDIKFSIQDDGTNARIYYTNTNSSNDYIVRIKQKTILKSQSTLTLFANTLVSEHINTTDLTYPQSENSFQLTIYVFNNTDNKYAFYELQGVIIDNLWSLNSRYIGDDMGVRFFIDNDGEYGKISYTNTSGNDAYIRYTKTAPITFEPLPVNKGGTGNDYLLPYAVLRGDGTNPIVGTEDFIYKDKTLILGNESGILLKNTTNASGLGTGGSFTTMGGASFEKDVFIGGELDVNLKNIRNVQDPVLDYDAVNKRYLDAEIDKIDLTSDVNDYRIEHTFALSNNILVSEDIPDFTYPSTVKAFITNVYIEMDGAECALYTIHGINCDSHWTISTIFTGQPTSINFNIREDGGNGIMQYTNANTEGTTYIRYRTISQVNDPESDSQINIPLESNKTEPVPIEDLEFLNSQLDSVKLIIYVSSETDNRYGLFLSNCVLKGDQWVMNTHATGNMQGVQFSIVSEPGKGTIYYKNTNSASDYTIRVKQINIETSQDEFILDANTTDPTIIDSTKLVFDNKDNYFQLSVVVHVPDLNKYALYELRGVICDNVWNINSRYIGDYTGIKFNILSSDNVGYLTYTNTNGVDANIKFIKNAPLASLKPLQVNKGGTGVSYLLPNAVLRGNGKDPVIATNDFIYDNNTLVLGNISSILLNSTRSATGLTSGGTFISYGGVSINKELLVGQQLIVKNVDITPNVDDIICEKSFDGNNNQNVPAEVNGFTFSHVNTKAFSSMATVTITTLSDIYDSLFELKGLKKSSGWALYSNHFGDDTGVEFTINNSGQIYYTSELITDWISTKIKFRAFTTTT